MAAIAQAKSPEESALHSGANSNQPLADDIDDDVEVNDEEE